MKWSDEEVSDAMNRTKGLPVRLCGETVRAIMTRAVDLMAARGGTMTADGLKDALDELRETVEIARDMENFREDDLLRIWQVGQHITTQGTMLALTLADLERVALERDNFAGLVQLAERKAVEDSRKIDNARASEAVWRKKLEAVADALADVAPGELGRLDVLGRVKVLKSRAEIRTTQVADLLASIEALRAAGAALSAHVDKTAGEPCLPGDAVKTCATCGPQPHRFQPYHEAGQFWRCSECGAVHHGPLVKTGEPATKECSHDLCGATCTKYGEPVLDRSTAADAIAVPDADRFAFDEGAEAMRAACINAVREALSNVGAWDRDTERLVTVALEGATP